MGSYVSADDEDTDRHAAVRLEHLSPTFVKWLDRETGFLKQRNGGYAELTLRLDKGRVGSLKWLVSFMPQQWRRDYDHAFIIPDRD